MNFWFNKNTKEYPDFWKEYCFLFEKKEPKSVLHEVRFVALDTETTGFNYEDDRILSIGAVALMDNSINVGDQLELFLKQDVFKSETVEIHGIRRNHSYATISESAALESFIKYIGNSILIAHHADFDRRMINNALQRQGLDKLKNKFIDTAVLFKKTKHLIYHTGDKDKNYSLDELCHDLKISKSDRHTASGDAFITAVAFLKIVSKLKKDKKLKFKDLFR